MEGGKETTEDKIFVDVSHTVESGMITYKGLPAPLICDYLSREASRKIYAEGIIILIQLFTLFCKKELLYPHPQDASFKLEKSKWYQTQEPM